MKTRSAGWQADFPIYEEFEDFAGKQRTFMITCCEGELGFTVRATEQGCENGYEFAAYSETSPYNALGRVREKAARRLARRHITGGAGNYQMLHHEVLGRITADGEKGTILVVDGIPLEIEDLAKFLACREGWEFRLRIVNHLK